MEVSTIAEALGPRLSPESYVIQFCVPSREHHRHPHPSDAGSDDVTFS